MKTFRYFFTLNINMTFFWILNFVSFLCLLLHVNCKEQCSEISANNWKCFIDSNNDQISCDGMKELSYSTEKIIQLTVKDLNEKRELTFFADQCNIIRLKVDSKIIPSNNLVKNLKNLELFIIQRSLNSVPEIFTGSLSNLLAHLNQVRIIKIEGFQIKLWDKDIFKSCLKVTEIDLKSLEITSIDFQSFINCKILKKLSIRFNAIPKLITSSFSGIRELRQLTLSSNGIVEIITNGNGWEKLENLEKIDLSNNKIEGLTSKLFFGLTGLMELNVMDNSLTTIATDAFIGLLNLKTLNLLKNSKLLSFDLNALSPFKKTLTKLYVDAEKIHCIYDKQLLWNYLSEIQITLENIKTCNIPRTEKGRNVTKSSIDLFHGRTEHSYSNKQLTLILTVTVLIVVLVFVIIFFVVYFVTSKLKIKKYKTSLSNSCRYSRTDTLSHHIPEFPGTYITNYTESEDAYGIFRDHNTLKNGMFKCNSA